MRVKVTEDYPGEIAALTADEIAGKLFTGFGKAAEAVFKSKTESSGEIDGLSELVDVLNTGFRARLDAMLKEALEDDQPGPTG